MRTLAAILIVLWAGVAWSEVTTVAPKRALPIGVNLAPINDWSTQQPFIDLMKTARPWIGHLPRRWGGVDEAELLQRGVLDASGWPTGMPADLAAIGTLVLTDLPEAATSLAGRYRLRFEGDGIVEVTGRAQNVRYGPNEVTFDYAPGPGSVDIRIQRTDSRSTGDYVRNITVVALDNVAAFEAGEVFDPDWLSRIDGFHTLRFMDWMQTNDSTLSRPEDFAEPTDYSYQARGLPPVTISRLADRLDAHGWINVPHLATDEAVQALAEVLRDTWPEDQTLYVEFSNEVWNFSFEQARWAAAQALAQWGAEDQGVQAYAGRAAEVAGMFDAVFTPDGGAGPVVNVISTQTGWIGLEEQILNAPLWVADDPTQRAAPAAYFDAYAITGYFGGVLGLEDVAPDMRRWIAESRATAMAEADAQGLIGEAREAYLTLHEYRDVNARVGLALQDGTGADWAFNTVAEMVSETLPYHAAVAERYFLDLIVYEGGSHVVGIGPMVEDDGLTAFFTQFNYSPEMGALYTQLLDGWDRLDGGVFAAFNDVYAPNKWGSWGHLRTQDDRNPRWDALTTFRDGP